MHLFSVIHCLDLVLTEQHVGNAVDNRELTTRLWAHKVALLHVHVQQRVVHFSKQLFVCVVLLGVVRFRQCLGDVERLGAGQERRPVNLGEHFADEVGVELRLDDLDLLRDDAQWEAVLDALLVAHEHVVCDEAHGCFADSFAVLWFVGSCSISHQELKYRFLTVYPDNSGFITAVLDEILEKDPKSCEIRI